MKILHTADWHIGKVLHKHPLQDELRLFFDWLLTTIEEESVDLLLVSGDIFDLANPSASDRALYYGFLKQLISHKLKIIITGGNHDAVGLLNAPKEILASLDITVIGGATENIEDELIIFTNKNDEPELIVAAVPFLRDKDLRDKKTDAQHKTRTEAIRAGILNHYRALYTKSKNRYPDTPVIAMGHLFTVGAEVSESERDIHVGNAAAVEDSVFDGFDYVALGHIHKPQRVAKNDKVRYSGSPIALSFSERSDNKCILILELIENKLGPAQVIAVPKFRELRRFSGSLKEVQNKLLEYQPTYQLPSFLELEIKEDTFSASVLSQVENLTELYAENEKFSILKSKTAFITGMKDTSDLYVEGSNIEDLKPQDVFDKRLELEELSAEIKLALKDTFLELLENIEQSDLA